MMHPPAAHGLERVADVPKDSPAVERVDRVLAFYGIHYERENRPTFVRYFVAPVDWYFAQSLIDAAPAVELPASTCVAWTPSAVPGKGY